jgi:L-amino acid N-acyltransferase YncA
MYIRFEPMAEEHRKPVIDLFNYYVENSFAAYPEARVGYEFFDRFLGMAKGYPAVVAKSDADEVAGFAFLHPYYPLSSFRRTAEITYFFAPDHTRKGLGKAALDHLVEAARSMGIDRLVASISSRNPASLAFHRKYGFEECARFHDIGRKFDQSFDLVWVIKQIGS